MVKVVYRRHLFCDAVSHAKGTLVEAVEVDMLDRGVGVASSATIVWRHGAEECVSRTSGSAVEATWKRALSSDQPLESACTCILIDSTNVTSSRMQEKERKG
jgi:hypothetical protein